MTASAAAIASLIASVVHGGESAPTTAHETMERLRHQAEVLRSSVSDPFPLLAGIHGTLNWAAGGLVQKRLLEERDRDVRETLAANCAAVVDEAKAARRMCAVRCAQWMLGPTNYDPAGREKVILTHGASRAVMETLLEGARQWKKSHGSETTTLPPAPFSVVWVSPTPESAPERKGKAKMSGEAMVAAVRKAGIAVRTCSGDEVAWALANLKSIPHASNRILGKCAVLLGADVVCQSGGVLTRGGAAGLSRQADAHRPKIKTYIVCERHKFTPFVFPSEDGSRPLVEDGREEDGSRRQRVWDDGRGEYQEERKDDVDAPLEYIVSLIQHPGAYRATLSDLFTSCAAANTIYLSETRPHPLYPHGEAHDAAQPRPQGAHG